MHALCMQSVTRALELVAQPLTQSLKSMLGTVSYTHLDVYKRQLENNGMSLQLQTRERSSWKNMEVWQTL